MSVYRYYFLVSKFSRKLGKFLHLLGHSSYRRGLALGVGASLEHRPILESLTPVTIVDIGANIGQFTLLAEVLFPQARVHAFEPLTSPANRFARLFAEKTSVVLHRCAIGAEEGSSPMNVSGAIDSSSLLPITAAQVAFAPGTDAVGIEDVSVRRLDTLLKPQDIEEPALLKIDVQGFEMSTLEGCGHLLALFRWVYIEASFTELYGGQALAPDIVDFLRKRGFTLAGVANPSFGPQGGCVQADFLFMSRNQTALA